MKGVHHAEGTQQVRGGVKGRILGCTGEKITVDEGVGGWGIRE